MVVGGKDPEYGMKILFIYPAYLFSHVPMVFSAEFFL